MSKGMRNIGSPDLVVLFTGTVSHKMVHSVLSDLDSNTRVARSHSSSMAALRGILEEHTV